MRLEDDIRQTFESIASELRPRADWANVEERISRSRHRGALRTFLAFMLIVAATSVVLPRVLPDGARNTLADPDRWRTYHDGDGWRLRYPPSWRAQTFEHICRVSRFGVAITNVREGLEQAEAAPHRPCPTDWSLWKLPNDFVIVEFHRSEGGPVGRERDLPDSPRPFDLAGAIRQTDSVGRISLGRRVGINGGSYSIGVRFGPDARETDKGVAYRIVASITPDAEGPMEIYRRLALADPETRRWLAGKRFRIVDYERHGPGTGISPCKPRPCVIVRIYVYTDDTVWSVSFDSDSRSVIRRGPGPHRTADDQRELGLSEEERLVAHQIADADAGVRREYGAGFGTHSHPTLAYDLNYVDREPCGKNRCAEVVYEFPGPRYLIAYVNLVTDRVVKITRRTG